MSDQRAQDLDDLMVITSEAGLPDRIMSFLIKNDTVACINDLCLITPDDIKELHQMYMDLLQNLKQMIKDCGPSLYQVT